MENKKIKFIIEVNSNIGVKNILFVLNINNNLCINIYILLFLEILCIFQIFFPINDYKGMQGEKVKSHNNFWIDKFWKLSTIMIFLAKLGTFSFPQVVEWWGLGFWLSVKECCWSGKRRGESCVTANFSSKKIELILNKHQLTFIGTHITTYIMTNVSICFTFNDQN